MLNSGNALNDDPNEVLACIVWALATTSSNSLIDAVKRSVDCTHERGLDSDLSERYHSSNLLAPVTATPQ